jgi:hypothetical protein
MNITEYERKTYQKVRIACDFILLITSQSFNFLPNVVFFFRNFTFAFIKSTVHFFII